jgi:hypothetical protein
MLGMADQDAGSHALARAILQAGPSMTTHSASDTGVAELDSPLRKLLLAATAQGLTRLAFEDHGDVGGLRCCATSRRGNLAARRHLAEATKGLKGYFRGEISCPSAASTWGRL